MREILFRGKRTDNSEWVEGGYYTICKKHFIVSGKRYKPDTRDWDIAEFYDNNFVYRPEFIEVDPSTVGQYTGLKDKNGKKIFEGDIVKIKDYSNGCALNYEQPTSNWAVKWEEKYARFKIDYMAMLPYRHFGESEIIGNIHDNKELLEVNNKK